MAHKEWSSPARAVAIAGLVRPLGRSVGASLRPHKGLAKATMEHDPTRERRALLVTEPAPRARRQPPRFIVTAGGATHHDDDRRPALRPLHRTVLRGAARQTDTRRQYGRRHPTGLGIRRERYEPHDE